MERKAILAAFWRAVAAQEKDPLREFFAEGAEVLWPNTNAFCRGGVPAGQL